MENLKVLSSLDQLNELRDYIKSKDLLAYDVETTGTVRGSKIVGFSVCGDLDLSYYVILRRWNPETKALEDLETLQAAPGILQALVGKKLIGHNFVFDAAQTETNFGVSLISSCYADTMVLTHLLDENNSIGLKETGVRLFGDDAKKEQAEMKESVLKNGGVLTKELYELYKADAELLGKYGAKDGILTMKIFYELLPRLYDEGLDAFFFDEESMPLLRGPTYEMNIVGLRVDQAALETLRTTLEAECLEAKSFIYKEIEAYVQEKYPGTKKTNTFNIGSSQQLAWLLYSKLGNTFETLTDGGAEVCKALGMKRPYSNVAKREFIQTIEQNKGRIWAPAVLNPKTGKMGRPKVIGDPWKYISCGAEEIEPLARKYKWVEKFLEYAKNQKLLNTYVEGIQSRAQYGIIRPSFKQCGTDSGRYSSSEPNFQNLPRKEKRIKGCIVARPGKVFVGADYDQLEPRNFASISGDSRLQACFASGDDFYSVVGVDVFDRQGVGLIKGQEGSFSVLYSDERDVTKEVALSSVYGTTAPAMAHKLDKRIDEAQEIIDKYFEGFPDVMAMMLKAHETVKKDGQVKSMFGRVRRIPLARNITKIYGRTQHKDLPYEARSMLNLAVNFPIQSAGASIINRASIAFYNVVRAEGIAGCHIVMQVHDELIVECFEKDAERVKEILRICMEETNHIPGVALIAKPVIAKNLKDLK